MSGTGVPNQVLKQAEEAEKLYQADLDAQLEAEKAASGEKKEVIKEDGGKPVDDTPGTPEQELEKAKHKYDVLKGKYDKEVPELALKLSEQAGELKALKEQIASLTAGKKDGDASTKKDDAPVIEEDPSIKYLQDEYPEVYKGLKTAVGKELKGLSEKIDKLAESVKVNTQEVHRTAEERYYDDLDTVKEWRVINKSEEFNDWLDQVEPLSGFKRRDILLDAHGSLDSNRVKSFYTSFLKETKPVEQPGEGSESAEEKARKAKMKGLAPDTTGTRRVADKSDNKTKMVKGSEIKKFYEDVRKGVYKGRDAERVAEEARLDAAVAAGMVSPRE